MNERVARIVSFLKRPEPSLGKVFRLRPTGFSLREIAAQLGAPRSAIAGKFRLIRWILVPFLTQLVA